MSYCCEDIQGLFDFLKASPTAFHAVESVCGQLQQQGFVPLQECRAWDIVPGGKYYVTRNRSSVIAFTLPKAKPESFRIVASHSDSPTFKIKENAEIDVRGKYVQLNTERYGGMIFSVVFTAIVFGFLHIVNLASGGDFGRTVQQTITASISGGLYAAVYLNTGTILPCMLFHFFHDIINLLFMSVSESGAMLEGITLASLIPQIIYSATELGLAIWYLRAANFDKIRTIWDEKWTN